MFFPIERKAYFWYGTKRMETHKETKNDMRILAIILFLSSLSFFFASIAFLWFHFKKTPEMKIAIPAGQTYLGPPSTPGETASDAKNVAWRTWEGSLFPYAFSYPGNLSLTDFDNDPTDAVALIWGDRPPTQNVLLSVINLSSDKQFAGYLTKPKKEFVENWWKAFPGLSGVSSVETFKNGKGLVGYKAQYKNKEGKTPNLDIFFEIPGKPELVIRIANGVLDSAVFDRIVDSVEWKLK